MTRPTAISKTDAINNISAEVERWLERAIPVINEKLKNFSAGSYRRIEDDEIGLNRLSNEAQSRAAEEIAKTFRASGWKVERDYGCQLDSGSAFTFS